MTPAGGPFLQRMPDGRVAARPIFESEVPIYLALSLGCLVASAAVVWNLAGMRHFGWAALALVAGLMGSAACSGLLVLGTQADLHVGLVVFGVQMIQIGFGLLLYLAQRPFVRGHAALSGAFLPTGTVIGVSFLLILFSSDLVFGLSHPLLFVAQVMA